MIDYYQPNIDLTLLGCGFLGTYHYGAIYLLSQIWPRKPFNRICGSSCGGLLGALLVAGLPLNRALAAAMDVMRDVRHLLSPWPSALFRSGRSVGHILAQVLDRVLPPTAHQLCSHRLGLSLTKLRGLENEFVSKFESRQELIDAVVAGCFIPIWSGSLSAPQFRGQKCVDGAYSDNQPKFVAGSSVGVDGGGQLAATSGQPVDGQQKRPPQTATPSDESDGERKLNLIQVQVCPWQADKIEVSPPPPPDRWRIFMIRVLGTHYYLTWDNLVRSNHAMIPMNPIKYRPYLLQGHRDMKDFILRSNLVKCRNCFAAEAAAKIQQNVAQPPAPKVTKELEAAQQPPQVVREPPPVLTQAQSHDLMDGISREKVLFVDGGREEEKLSNESRDSSSSEFDVTKRKPLRPLPPACIYCLRLLEKVDSLKVSDVLANIIR